MPLLSSTECFVLATLGFAAVSASNVSLPKIPSHPFNASQVLDLRLASFSFETAYLPSFTGNKSNPNTLTLELMQRLVERTGVGPDIRPGGITIGPGFYDLLDLFPISSRFVVDVNLGNNSVDIAEAEIAAGIKYLGWERIFSLELGNEPDHYPGSSRPSNWSSSDYTAQFLNWTAALTERLSLPTHIFQVGAFADDPTSAALMTTVDVINEGIDTTGVIKLFDQHTYQYSTCDPVRNAIATLPNLINHQNITAYLDLWKPQIAAAKSRGKEFVVGEYSSVSCSGKENVTDTFGQALWLADTVLYGAFLNISRLYLHQGATLVFQSSDQANAPGFSWYDLWYPVETDRYGVARASPSFVAYLLIDEAVGSSGKSQLSLIDVPDYPQLVIYAIWDSHARSDGVARLAVLNLAVRNVSASVNEIANGTVTVDLSPYVRAENGARLKRMTSPGLDSKDVGRVTWAGQSYENGTASGIESVEMVTNGTVTVRGSEGVLVFF